MALRPRQSQPNRAYFSKRPTRGIGDTCLTFGGLEAFATLVEQDAYYVVTAEHPDNSMRLSLAFRNPACVHVFPSCLTFEARSAPYSVVVMADAAIRENI